MRIKITPPMLAKRYGIHPDKVLTWINNGELRAFNAATAKDGRPRYLIDEDDVAAFEQSRSTVQTPTPKPAPRKRRPVKQYV